MKILVVERQQQNTEPITTALKTNYFEVDAVWSAHKGVECAFVNEYDLIILSSDLPSFDTQETLCKKIREKGNETPILILSEDENLETKIQHFQDGADDYLLKPFACEELIARVRALLRRPKKIEQETLTIDDIVINLATHTVLKNTESVILTRKEFMLLTYLMKHENLVLSRAQIMEHVWQMETDPFSNTIETHILSLRKKLGDRKNPKNIQTVSGCGYKICSKTKDTGASFDSVKNLKRGIHKKSSNQSYRLRATSQGQSKRVRRQLKQSIKPARVL